MRSSAASTPPLSNARLRVLRAVSDLGGQHVTIAQLAGHLGGHPNASRAHLSALVVHQLLAVADVPGTGPGRRPRGYSLTDAGRRAVAPTSAETIGLAGAFASYLVQTGHGAKEAREIGQLWGEQQASALPADTTANDSVEAVVEVLDILGFDPARLEVPDGEALVLRTCPLLPAAPDDPTFICEVHHGLIDGVLRRIGASEGITLLPFSEPDGCRVELGGQPRSA